jgi:hypothetical protein
VQPGTAYTYEIEACDFHANCSAVNINVTTPPAGAIDPREVGVRPTGTYWGSGGEQIDMRSGNLNFSIPLVKAMSRTGGGATFNLSYNSENWRQDPGGEWQLGRDIGYGYGWRLSAGSLTPIYDSIWHLDHYEFTDSTGAPYRLDQNVQGSPVWSSKETTDNGYIHGNTPAAQVFILIHELAHLGEVPGFVPDAKSQQAGIDNNVLIDQNCGAAIKWIQKNMK